MPFFQLPPTGSITPEWYKALRLQLDRDDDEKEQKVRMGLERRFEREMRGALDDMLNTLFPEGYSEFANPQIEANRIHEAFLRDQKLRDTVSRALQDGVDLGVSVAVDQLAGVGYGFDYTLANVTARQWALAHTDTLLQQLGTTSGRVVGQAVGRWVDNGEPLQNLVNDLRPSFGEQRARLIASTEITRAYAQGTKEAYRESGVVKKLVWQTANDERRCLFCGGLQGKVVGIEQSFDEALPANLRPQIKPFTAPPAHPGCRCWIVAEIDEPKRQRKPKLVETAPPVQQPTPAGQPATIPPSVTTPITPQAQFVRSQIQRTAQEFGVTETEVESAIRGYVPTLTGGDIALRVPSTALDGVLRDGRLKSQFETGRSAGGGLNTAARAEAEQNGLGIPVTIAPTQRPVYAYVRNAFSEEYVEAYGDTTIVFKSDVRQSATYTVGDSLDAMRRNQARGVGLGEVSEESWGGNVNRLYRMATGRVTPDASGLDYIEVQLRDATIQRIDRVIDNEGSISGLIRRQLRDRNIPVVNAAGEVLN